MEFLIISRPFTVLTYLDDSLNEYDVFADVDSSSLSDDIGPFDPHTFPTFTKLSQKASKLSLTCPSVYWTRLPTLESSSPSSLSSPESASYVISNFLTFHKFDIHRHLGNYCGKLKVLEIFPPYSSSELINCTRRFRSGCKDERRRFKLWMLWRSQHHRIRRTEISTRVSFTF